VIRTVDLDSSNTIACDRASNREPATEHQNRDIKEEILLKEILLKEILLLLYETTISATTSPSQASFVQTNDKKVLYSCWEISWGKACTR